MELFSTEPLILTIEDFITEEECDYIIKIAKDKIAENKDSKLKHKKNKNILNSCLINNDTDKTIKNIFNKASKLLRTKNNMFESLYVINFKKYQEINPHHDAWDKNNKEDYKKHCKERGNRVFTLSIYLNNVRQGGETLFNMTKDKIKPLSKDKIKPLKCKALLFKNINENGTLNKKSNYSELPVTKGEKWICYLYLREKPISKLNNGHTQKVLHNLPELDLEYIDENISDED